MSKYFNLILHTIKNTFTSKGRASRKELIVFHVFYFSSIAILYNLKGYINEITSTYISILVFFCCVINLFLTIPPLFSLFIRRMHDLNASGWWLLITIIPFGLILFFALPFKKGTEGPNKYGHPPEY